MNLLALRVRLRDEWISLDNKLFGKYGRAGSSLRRRLHKVERLLERVNVRIWNSHEYKDLPFQKHTSVFESESLYRGFTVYGHVIGEGCYWRKTGHS